MNARDLGKLLEFRAADAGLVKKHLAGVPQEIARGHYLDGCPALPNLWQDGVGQTRILGFQAARQRQQ